MLKGIPKILSPELLKVLCEMGHSDQLVIADGNFPSESIGKDAKVIRMDGHGTVEVLKAILKLFPLDTYVEHPVQLMEVMPGDPVETPIWDEYRKTVKKYEERGTAAIGTVERFAFYDTVLVEDVLREGDTLIITELDRLGRNKQEILKQLQILKDKGVRVMVLELPTTLIDLSQMDNALARLMIETINNVLIEIYASLAQAEMEKKEKRQREGMEAKKLRGEWDEVGRPRAIEPEKFNQEFLRVIEKEVTPTQLQRELGLTASTFYRYRKDFFEKFPQFVQFQK